MHNFNDSDACVICMIKGGATDSVSVRLDQTLSARRVNKYTERDVQVLLQSLDIHKPLHWRVSVCVCVVSIQRVI